MTKKQAHKLLKHAESILTESLYEHYKRGLKDALDDNIDNTLKHRSRYYALGCEFQMADEHGNAGKANAAKEIRKDNRIIYMVTDQKKQLIKEASQLDEFPNMSAWIDALINKRLNDLGLKET